MFMIMKKSMYQNVKVNLIAIILFMREDQNILYIYRYLIGIFINDNLLSKYYNFLTTSSTFTFARLAFAILAFARLTLFATFTSFRMPQ